MAYVIPIMSDSYLAWLFVKWESSFILLDPSYLLWGEFVTIPIPTPLELTAQSTFMDYVSSFMDFGSSSGVAVVSKKECSVRKSAMACAFIIV